MNFLFTNDNAKEKKIAEFKEAYFKLTGMQASWSPESDDFVDFMSQLCWKFYNQIQNEKPPEKVYKLILYVHRTHWEGESDQHQEVVKMSLSKDTLIKWYNNNFKSLRYEHAKPFKEGEDVVKFKGNLGGGCFSVDCTVSIKEYEILI